MSTDEWRDCPHCGKTVPDTDAEVRHMKEAHPEVIAERMRNAGFVWDGNRWVDTLVNG